MNYFDSTYVVRCYLDEPGAEAVRAVASKEQITCVEWGQVEVAAAFHRKLREGVLTPEEFEIVSTQLERDIAEGVFTWLPVCETHFRGIRKAFAELPQTVFLRAADALHLVAARDGGFTEIYTNDGHMLAAAPHFGLLGVNVISAG